MSGAVQMSGTVPISTQPPAPQLNSQLSSNTNVRSGYGPQQQPVVTSSNESNGPASIQNIQRILDENSGLIKTISDYQNLGKHQETMNYQWSLHRNLLYLASIAESNQNLHNLLPPPGQVPPPSNNMAPSGPQPTASPVSNQSETYNRPVSANLPVGQQRPGGSSYRPGTFGPAYPNFQNQPSYGQQYPSNPVQGGGYVCPPGPAYAQHYGQYPPAQYSHGQSNSYGPHMPGGYPPQTDPGNYQPPVAPQTVPQQNNYAPHPGQYSSQNAQSVSNENPLPATIGPGIQGYTPAHGAPPVSSVQSHRDIVPGHSQASPTPPPPSSTPTSVAPVTSIAATSQSSTATSPSQDVSIGPATAPLTQPPIQSSTRPQPPPTAAPDQQQQCMLPSNTTAPPVVTPPYQGPVPVANYAASVYGYPHHQGYPPYNQGGGYPVYPPSNYPPPVGANYVPPPYQVYAPSNQPMYGQYRSPPPGVSQMGPPGCAPYPAYDQIRGYQGYPPQNPTGGQPPPPQ